MESNLKLHHIGIGVSNLDEVLDNIQSALGLFPSDYVNLSGSRAALIPVGELILEFIEPSDSPTNQASESLYRQVKERGSCVHHLAFEVNNIDLALKKTLENGCELTVEGLIEGKGGKFAWLKEETVGGFMIEICDKGYQVK